MLSAVCPPTDQAAGLGRLYAPDPRDRAHELTPKSMIEIPRGVIGRRKLPWRLGPILDQGTTSECVIFTAAQLMQSAPFIHALGWERSRFTQVYLESQKHDEFPGENYNGTSMRGAMKVLTDLGLIREYLWCYDEDTAREYLVTRGMMGFGTDWFAGMNTPSAKGAYVEPEGSWQGGHEYTMRWYYNSKHRKYPDSYEFVNSWGPDYGDRGLFRMKADSVRHLWLQRNGDLVSPIETFRR